MGSLPRDVRLTGGGTAVLALAAGMAVAAVLIALVMMVAYTGSREARDLRRRDGVATTAEVVNIVLRSDGKNRTRVATYVYAADGRSLIGRVRLRQSNRSVDEGTPLSIVYLRGDPQTSWAIGYEPQVFPLWVIPLTVIPLLFAAGAVARSVIRQQTLLSEGRAVLARVIEQKAINKDKRRAYRITCEFEALSGARCTTRYQVSKMPPPVGSIVPIVYHRDDPTWSAAYPLGLVQTIRRPS